MKDSIEECFECWGCCDLVGAGDLEGSLGIDLEEGYVGIGFGE
jgi:hypothetical protein